MPIATVNLNKGISYQKVNHVMLYGVLALISYALLSEPRGYGIFDFASSFWLLGQPLNGRLICTIPCVVAIAVAELAFVFFFTGFIFFNRLPALSAWFHSGGTYCPLIHFTLVLVFAFRRTAHAYPARENPKGFGAYDAMASFAVIALFCGVASCDIGTSIRTIKVLCTTTRGAVETYITDTAYSLLNRVATLRGTAAIFRTKARSFIAGRLNFYRFIAYFAVFEHQKASRWKLAFLAEGNTAPTGGIKKHKAYTANCQTVFPSAPSVYQVCTTDCVLQLG